MLIFDIENYIGSLKRNGIDVTDRSARSKLEILIDYYKYIRKYSESKSRDYIKRIASGYFSLMPDGEPERIIHNLWQRKNPCSIFKSNNIADKTVTIYASEWDKIMELESKDEQKLAYAALVTLKFVGREEKDGELKYYPSTFVKKDDVWALSGVGSSLKKKETWYKLKQLGFISSDMVIGDKKTAKIRFGVPYNADLKEDKSGEEVLFEIKNFANIMSYFNERVGSVMTTHCEVCGEPMSRRNGRQLCPACLKNKKKEQGKKYREKSKSEEKQRLM